MSVARPHPLRACGCTLMYPSSHLDLGGCTTAHDTACRCGRLVWRRSHTIGFDHLGVPALPSPCEPPQRPPLDSKDPCADPAEACGHDVNSALLCACVSGYLHCTLSTLVQRWRHWTALLLPLKALLAICTTQEHVTFVKLGRIPLREATKGHWWCTFFQLRPLWSSTAAVAHQAPKLA